jgi:biopolymer transport protein ExbD
MPFRRRSALHTWEMNFGPNMTPMVDVVMVILIFFMASTSFVGTEWFLRAAIPRAGEAQQQAPAEGDPFRLPPARFEILLSHEPGIGTIASGRGIETGPVAELPAQLRELAHGAGKDDVILIIRSQPHVPYADVIRAHEGATAAGIEKIGLLDAD